MTTSNKSGAHSGTDHDAEASSPSWSSPSTVSTMATDCGPRCARIDGVDWVVWKGKSDNYLWYTIGSDGQWSIPNGLGIQTSSSPAIAAYNGLVYVFWRDASDDYIYYATYDGHSWTHVPGYRVPGSTTTAGPAAASFDGKLYLAWSASSKDLCTLSRFDGSDWYGPQFNGYVIQAGPALAVGQNLLLYSYCQTINGIGIARQVDNRGTTVPSAQSDDGPALASDSENLWVMWKDFNSGNLMTSTISDTQLIQPSSPSATASGMSTPYSPGMCGDSTGLRCVWADVENFTVKTSTRAPVQPMPPTPPTPRPIPPRPTPTPTPTTDRPVPPQINGADQNTISGVTAYNYYVTITVTSSEGDQLTNTQTQAKSDGSWACTLDYTLTQGMTIKAVTSEDKDSPASGAYVKVIGQFQTSPLRITSVETGQVSGVAPETGQVIKAWRQSDGALMVLYPVPAASPTSDGKTFTAPYVRDMKLNAGDLLCVVSQFPKDGTMTPFNRQYEGYSSP